MGHRMGFLLMAFVNWRDLWLRNESHALAHDPKLIDDPFQNELNQQNSSANSSLLEFKPIDCSEYESLGLALLRSSNNQKMNDGISRNDLVVERFENGKAAKLSDNNIVIDTSLIIPTYVYSNDANAYYSTHRAHECETDFCLKIFECNALEKTMLDPIFANLLKFKQLHHENFAKLFDVRLNILDNGNVKKLELLSPWYCGGSLYDIIDMSPKDTPFALHVIKRMILQIASFMDWLHQSCKIAHGHLKSRNILFDNGMNVCVTDIGLISLKRTMTVILPNCNFDGYWMDREYFDGKSITTKCDVWAFGFILFELVTKKQPFEDAQNDINYIRKCIVQRENMPKLPPHCSSFLKKLINLCWANERAKRPTFKQIVQMTSTEMM